MQNARSLLQNSLSTVKELTNFLQTTLSLLGVSLVLSKMRILLAYAVRKRLAAELQVPPALFHPEPVVDLNKFTQLVGKQDIKMAGGVLKLPRLLGSWCNSRGMYVRPAYLALHEKIREIREDSLDEDVAERVLLQGCPGSGKSMFLLYELLRILDENRDSSKFKAILILGSSSEVSAYAYSPKAGWFKFRDPQCAFNVAESSGCETCLFMDVRHQIAATAVTCTSLSVLNQRVQERVRESDLIHTRGLYCPSWELCELQDAVAKLTSSGCPPDGSNPGTSRLAEAFAVWGGTFSIVWLSHASWVEPMARSLLGDESD